MTHEQIKQIQKDFIKIANEDLKEKGYEITDLLREDEFFIKNLNTNETYYITSGIAMGGYVGTLEFVNYYSRYHDILNVLIDKMKKGKGIKCEKVHETC